LLNCFPRESKEWVTNSRKVINVAAGTIIFKAGETPKGIYRVFKGKVKKSTVSIIHKEHIFNVRGALEYLGYHALLSDEHYANTAAALAYWEIELLRVT